MNYRDVVYFLINTFNQNHLSESVLIDAKIHDIEPGVFSYEVTLTVNGMRVIFCNTYNSISRSEGEQRSFKSVLNYITERAFFKL